MKCFALDVHPCPPDEKLGCAADRAVGGVGEGWPELPQYCSSDRKAATVISYGVHVCTTFAKLHNTARDPRLLTLNLPNNRGGNYSILQTVPAYRKTKTRSS